MASILAEMSDEELEAFYDAICYEVMYDYEREEKVSYDYDVYDSLSKM